MNTNKKNSTLNNGWILCPSKSFPGKFYYFNVLNGEAAWSLSDVDNKDPRKSHNIHNLADHYHNYPEPTTVPDDMCGMSTHFPTTVRQPQFQTTPYVQHMPTFGQASFSKYVSDVHEPMISNIVWTPIQVPMTMYCQEPRKRLKDKVTQTFGLERGLFIQSCDIPLCKRFKNYEVPSLSFDSKNKIMKSDSGTSTPKQSSVFGMYREPQSEDSIQKSKSLIKEPVLKLDTQCISSIMPETKINRNQSSTLNCGNKVEITMADTKVPASANEEIPDNLEQSDLRFLLLAKRRKSYDAAIDRPVERKKSKPSDTKKPTPKKKVTFDLSDTSEDTVIITHTNIQEDALIHTDSANQNRDAKEFVPTSSVLRTEDTIPFSPDKYFKEVPKEVPKPSEVPEESTRRDTWYLVVDADVLLLDYKLIENIVLSDSKCRLVIPHAVRADIEALCLGDCRGQQRVISARQITRRLATPPTQYIMEPPEDTGDRSTTESVINCCVRAVNDDHHVVLITNDPYLQSKANLLNITNYQLNEIQNGGTIKPDITSDINQSKLSINNNIPLKTSFIMNKLNPLDNVKKQVFNNERENPLNCDKLINITKPKSLIDNFTYIRDNTESDISRKVKFFNLIDKNDLKAHNRTKNPFVPQNSVNDTNRNENNNLGNNILFQNSFNSEGLVSSSNKINSDSISKPNHEKESSSLKTKLICSIPKTYLKQIDFNKPNFVNSQDIANKKQDSSEIIIANTNQLQYNPSDITKHNRLLTTTQTRIKKMLNNIKCKPSNTLSDSTGLFKIPQPVQFKTRAKTTALTDSLDITDKNRTKFEMEGLKRFSVKSQYMKEKLNSRMDEWICTYTQIMEYVLNALLQKNSDCIKNTVAPLTLHETLNCIKMVHGSDKTIRSIVDNLSDLLNESTCVKGKLTITPDDFMRMVGYGVLLVQALKSIQPQYKELIDAESGLNSLLKNIESNSMETDPDLLREKTAGVSRTDTDEVTERDRVVRPNFVKEPMYVVNYLKKHFTQWASCTDLESEHQRNQNQNVTDFNILRTCGKNLNMLKINSSKKLSLAKTPEVPTRKAEPEVIRLLDNNQVNINLQENCYVKEKDNETLQSHLTAGYAKYQNIIKNDQIINLCEDKINKPIHVKETEIIKTTDITDKRTLNQREEIAGPVIIRQAKVIDEYEERIKNKEPLDLEMLDYSEIYEASSFNEQFDVCVSQTEINTYKDDSYNKTGDSGLSFVSKDSYKSDNNRKSSETYFSTEDITGNIDKTDKNNEITEIYEISDDTSHLNTDNHTNQTNKVIVIKDNDATRNVTDVTDNDAVTEIFVRDDSTNDSGFENDSTYAHSVVKKNLSELSTTFKVICAFVENFIMEICSDNLCEDKKQEIHEQASKSLEHMTAIVQLLKSIIKRESAEDTVLKTLLLNAGVEATSDKRITRYRQVVIKSLKQAQIMEKALKIIVSVTMGEFDAIATNGSSTSSIRYFNIFE